jgi:hypothetical protein
VRERADGGDGGDGKCKNDEVRAKGCVKLSGWSAEGRCCCGNAKLRGWEEWLVMLLGAFSCVHFRRGSVSLLVPDTGNYFSGAHVELSACRKSAVVPHGLPIWAVVQGTKYYHH